MTNSGELLTESNMSAITDFKWRISADSSQYRLWRESLGAEHDDVGAVAPWTR